MALKFRTARATAAREVLIVAGRRLGATVEQLALITGLNTSNISRRHAAAITKRPPQAELYDPVERVIESYDQVTTENTAIKQA